MNEKKQPLNMFCGKNKYRSSRPEVFCKKGVLHEACNFIKKETLAQVFSYEFCKIYIYIYIFLIYTQIKICKCI